MKKGKLKPSAADFDLQKMIAAAEQFVDEHIIPEFLKGHQDPPRVHFYIFSRLIPLKNGNGCFLSFLAKPAGMWGAESLDQALEAATRQYPLGERVLLRLDFKLPDPSPFSP